MEPIQATAFYRNEYEYTKPAPELSMVSLSLLRSASEQALTYSAPDIVFLNDHRGLIQYRIVAFDPKYGTFIVELVEDHRG